MQLLYTIGIRLYGFAIRMVALTGNQKAKAWIDGRKNYFDQLPDFSNKKVTWFHCASLGEFDQGLPLMKLLKKEDPSTFIFVTFFSPSGMEHYHKRNHPADAVAYLPLDTPSNAKKFIALVQPQKSFFVKYEFWINLIHEAKRNGSKVYNISGIFRENQRFFKWHGGFFRKGLELFDWFFVQNESSKKLLNNLGISNVSVTGDSRFDKVLENKFNLERNPLIESFKNNEKLFIIGSSWPEDEAILFPWLSSYDGKVLIAPHDIKEKRIEQIQSQLDGAIRYSEAKGEDLSNSKFLILDTIGQLSAAYSYGSIAYVGGGFSGNLHNILEPAVFGIPVIFGPKHVKFPEAEAFQKSGFGFSVNSTEELKKSYEHILRNNMEICQNASKFVQRNSGASQKILKHITSN